MLRKYAPGKDLLKGIRNMFPLEIAPWDEYFMAMAQTDFLRGKQDVFASKSYFIRKAPFGGSFAILGGLHAFLRTLADFSFADPEVQKYLRDQGYSLAFRRFLRKKDQLDLAVFAPPEGSIFLPHEPIITVEGDLISVRIAEGILTREVNFPSLAMTKWSRCAQVASSPILEFSRRRAQDANRTSLYAYMGGASITSNAEIRRAFDIPCKGTMGHEWIQSIGDEYDAFDLWLEHNPDKPVLLVDTISTIDSGIPNAIKAFKKHKKSIKEYGGQMGIRLDSGDLAYLAIHARDTFDSNNLEDVKIYMTNDLDEYSISSISHQISTDKKQDSKATENVLSKLVWAAGTKPGTCYDQPSLGGVMKLMSISNFKHPEEAFECDVMKLAKDNPIKCSIPGSNRVMWALHKGVLAFSVLYHKNEKTNKIRTAFSPENCFVIDNSYCIKSRLRVVFKDRKILLKQSIEDIRDLVNKEKEMLHWSHLRLDNPAEIPVCLSERVFTVRQGMIEENKIINK